MNVYYCAGMLLLVSMLLVNRFVMPLPGWVAVTLLIASAILIVIGIIKKRKSA